MDINIVWHDRNFNIELSNGGKDPFLVVKGCRIMSGSKGEFVAPPSTKGNNDKYWNHAYLSTDFGKVVLEKAKESQPVQPAKQPEKQQSKQQANDFSDDIPW